MPVRPRLVALVCFPGVQPLDVVGPHEVFAGANQAMAPADRRYELRVVASRPGTVTSESGLGLVAGPLPSGAVDTVVVAGGDGVHDARRDERPLAWLRRTAPRARRIASVCSGAFVLAEAGLLDGRRATTHWARAGRLAREFPAVDVDADAIFRRDGHVWTSAGVTAGIDLSLALVEDDHGAAVAQTIARWLVMFLRRPGGQSQYAAPVWTEAPATAPVRAAVEAIHADPAADHRLERLARRVGLSSRHLSRAFAAETGVTPGRYVERVRVEHARRLLEQGDATLAAVAAAVGLGTAETLRRAFLRQVGVPPDAYRRRFRLAS